ncbi:zinc finger protein 276 isoform X2 [Nerophis lumbriciformis]|uniref:zinc finger protein 276 isoform X2 n=1 Tax=Nerophis lumbriciformis TaxID=546530 RepID=UPI003BAA9AB9
MFLALGLTKESIIQTSCCQTSLWNKMKRKRRGSRPCEAEKRARGNRRAQKNVHAATPALQRVTTDANYTSTNQHKQTEIKSNTSSRLSAAVCRLCHGKFSARSLRHAFSKWPQDSLDVVKDKEYAAAQSPALFHTDFQRLVGVQLDPDPRLSAFVCKKCHSKFYKCNSILLHFLQMVNVLPVGKDNPKSRHHPMFSKLSVSHESTSLPSFSSDPKCLHKLVSWAHHHAEACRSCPDLKEVLEGRCWGFVKAVWRCVDGHSYTLDTHSTSSVKSGHMLQRGSIDERQERSSVGIAVDSMVGQSLLSVTQQTCGSALADWSSNTEDSTDPKETICAALKQHEDRMVESDLSDRVLSEEEFEDKGKSLSEDESFEPYSDKSPCRATVPTEQRQMSNISGEPKVKKKPGPKPGWKNQFKPKGEELPNIYKCPCQGCTAVYRAPDGLKKHIKEHHDEVRERPCPHPGCNKVFTIDRYLQRHVKLIHTEERNYICDQCGQTFKQRKHLSVHQMRHSGAKPLQCEVCGFQCRQRASLKYHMTKHKAEADLEFACLMCSKRFEKAHNLNVHMSMVHPLTQSKAHQEGGPPQQHPFSNLHAVTCPEEAGPQEQDR